MGCGRVDKVYDLAVIGGGINGCGIARDAAGRGLSVYLCEMNDLASGTSSHSTKLIHGGLRYLEYRQFRLVREALIEREVLWALAPHLIRPMRFVLPHHRGLRPAWLLRLGLFLYDHLGGRKLLPATTSRDLRRHEVGKPLKVDRFARGFEYSDCWVDDARLVVLNAIDAAQRGATVATRTEMIRAEREGGLWSVTVQDKARAEPRTIRARALVNAAGPWVAQVLSGRMHIDARTRVRLVQGSHIVVRKLYEHDRCYIFQNTDGRIVFVIPYENDYSLIGTTDRDYHGDPADATATEDEIAYLCATVSDYLVEPVVPADVIWAYSGVRPLYDDGSSDAKAATRDYVLDLDVAAGRAPLVSVFGGKITTYRRLAEAALGELTAYLPALAGNIGWTAKVPLPGGDMPIDGRIALAEDLRIAHPFLTAQHAVRLASAYGTRARHILEGARAYSDLGVRFGADLTAAEVRHLVTHEWAVTAEDILWRRTKLGLAVTETEASALRAYLHALHAEGTAMSDAAAVRVELARK